MYPYVLYELPFVNYNIASNTIYNILSGVKMSLAYSKNATRKKISQVNGDALDLLNSSVDWDAFVPELNAAIPRRINRKGGRPPFNNLFMFKILIVKWLYKLSFDQTEYQINEQRSFKRFLGCEQGDLLPDAKTIWLYKDILSKSGSVPVLVDILNQEIEQNRTDRGDPPVSGADFMLLFTPCREQ